MSTGAKEGRSDAGAAAPRGGLLVLLRRHPIITGALVALVLVLGAANAVLIVRGVRYRSETARLRAGMSDVERRRADMIEASEGNRVRIALELVRRQARGDHGIHLAVAVDSGIMRLERDGIVLREMRVSIGPERRVGTPPDTVHVVAPRGARTIERVLGSKTAWEVPAWVFLDRAVEPPEERTIKGALGPAAIVLSGGAVIYGTPESGPLADSVYVLPGALRARNADLRAIAPNLSPGMSVYFY